MLLAEYNHVVQAVAPDGSNQPLRIRVLPWAGRTRHDLSDIHAGDTAPEHVPVDDIAIPQQPPRRGVVRKASMICCAVHAAVGCSVTAG